MEIFFDWELDENAEQPIQKWVYEDIRAFLKTRYKPLEEKIDEIQPANQPPFVVFVWHNNGDVELKDFNIPKELREKLKDCITESDMDYIMETIGRKIDKKGNEN